MNGRRRLRLATVAVLALGLAGAAASVPAAAAAAATADSGAPGYVRFAHLSPDTTPLDGRIATGGSDQPLTEQDALGYGSVSAYVPLAAGTYSIELVPSGAPAGTAPVVSGGLELAAGEAVTIAAIGLNVDLQNVVLEDDLSSPAAGLARVRAVDAAALVDGVDSVSAAGAVLLEGSALGDAGDYAEVEPGTAELSLIADSIEDIASVDLAAGSVQTLFVVNDSQGALTVISAVDAVAVAEAPVGGVATGGGALAEAESAQQTIAVVGLGGILVLLAGVVVLRIRHVRRHGTGQSES